MTSPNQFLQSAPNNQNHDALHILKLRILKVLLTLATFAILVIWFVESQAGRILLIDQIAYPIMSGSFICYILLVQRSPKLLPIAETLSLMTFAVYLVLYVYGIIYQLLPHTTIYDMATFTQWFPLVYTAAFMFLSTRRAQIFCIVMYLLLLIPTILKTVFGHSAFIESDVYALLFNMNVAHPVFIAVLAGIAQFKESLVRATRHADQMRIAAHIDHLTGIPNRRAADQAMRQALNQNRQLSLILFDIDHFKVVNDTYGHDVGDEALIQIAQIVQHALLANEIFGRWGGEEFLIVLPGVALTEALERAETFRRQIQTHAKFRVTASFGVTEAHPDDRPEWLIKRADEALYRAKQHGRNCVEAEAGLLNELHLVE